MFKNAACNGKPTEWWFPERTDKSGPDNIENWDSYNGLLLIDELESEFNVKFSVDETYDVKIIEDIKRHLKNHGVILDD